VQNIMMSMSVVLQNARSLLTEAIELPFGVEGRVDLPCTVLGSRSPTGRGNLGEVHAWGGAM